MVSERTGGGDPTRTLELLWRVGRPARRGPRPGLSVGVVVESATALADREGLGAITMRRLAGDLGVAAMTLYTYVPGKAELLDLMLDAAYGVMPRADTTGQSWRSRLTAVAGENRALFRDHPWAAEVSAVRPPLGPGLIAKYEHELKALEGLGLDDVTMDAALTHLLGFVQACARAEADVAALRTDVDDQRWWEANAPLLERVLDPGRYPLASRVGSAAGAAHGAAYSPEHTWNFGLARVLDGLAALIEGR